MKGISSKNIKPPDISRSCNLLIIMHIPAIAKIIQVAYKKMLLKYPISVSMLLKKIPNKKITRKKCARFTRPSNEK
jgi:hypothetical protein